jgi:hypothetical protein
MIELGFNEIEKHYDFYNLVRYKSGKKKGQVKYTQLTPQGQAAQQEWRAKEKARLAEKYGLPKFWEEGLREKLGNEKVNDLRYVGEDKWYAVEGNREKREREAELSGRGMMETHTHPDGTIMTGKTHTKSSKIIGGALMNAAVGIAPPETLVQGNPFAAVLRN